MDKLKQLINVFSRVPKDKLAHFFSGSVLFTLCMFFSSSNDIISSVIVLVFALAKELIWDGLMKKGTLDIVDAMFTFLPVIFYFLR